MPVIREMGILVGYCFLMNYVKSAEAVRIWEWLRAEKDLRIEYKIRLGNYYDFIKIKEIRIKGHRCCSWSQDLGCFLRLLFVVDCHLLLGAFSFYLRHHSFVKV